jgi:putative hydrolases of HD superfamily
MDVRVRKARSETMDIQKVFAFIHLTQKFRGIVRDVAVDGGKRFENDMEHSYQLAMLVWYMNSAYKLGYDTKKLCMYSLIHDLVETYAGDTPALTSSAEVISSKFDREEEAFKKIREEIPEFKELQTFWEQYESRKDKESRLVYVIDKVMPILNEIQQDSGFYKLNKISLIKWKAYLKSKTDEVDYKELDDAGVVEGLLNYLEKNKDRLFF